MLDTKLLIAAINGPAVGFGVELTLAATPDSQAPMRISCFPSSRGTLLHNDAGSCSGVPAMRRPAIFS